jgi:hypothetical protein
MSKLRKHLETARKEYEQAHYPGDLAADVLRPARNWGPSLAWASVAAAAAVVITAISLYGPHSNDRLAENRGGTPDTESYVEVPPAFSPSEMGSDEALVVPATFGPSEMGSDEALAMPAMDFGFSMPSITFEEEQTEATNPTT